MPISPSKLSNLYLMQPIGAFSSESEFEKALFCVSRELFQRQRYIVGLDEYHCELFVISLQEELGLTLRDIEERLPSITKSPVKNSG